MKKIIFMLIFISQLTFSQKDNFYTFNLLNNDLSYKTHTRYEDILNFSKPTTKLNLYSMYVDLRQYDNYSKIYWNIGQGYIYLTDSWDLEYSLEKNFVTYQKKEVGDKGYNGWELDFLIRNHLHKFNWVGHTWARSWGFGASYSDGGDLEYDLFDDKVTDIFLTHRISTNFDNIGLGGSYLSITTNAGGVISSIKDDGYRLNLIIDTFTNWGYGFQTANSLTNELRSYGNYDNSYLLDFTTITSWTYELSNDFAFSVDLFFETENFLCGTERANKIEFNIFPHIAYNTEINDSLRFFANVGVTPISYVDYSNGYNDSGFYAKVIVGITYRW